MFATEQARDQLPTGNSTGVMGVLGTGLADHTQQMVY